MKRWTVVSVCGFMVLVLIATSPGFAKSSKEPNEFFEVTCFVAPGSYWTGGEDEKMFHVRGEMGLSTLYDVEPPHGAVGTNSVVTNLNVNTATGKGQVWGTFSTVFDVSPGGTIDGTYNGKLAPGPVFVSKAVGQGTGTLKGQKLKSTLVGIDPGMLPLAILLDLPCDPTEIVGVFHDSGFIHSRGN